MCSIRNYRTFTLAVVLFLGAALQLSGCAGMELPPVTVTLPIAQDVQISRASLIAGQADIFLGAVCGLFNREDLDRRIRESAGDAIADLVEVTRVELTSTDIVATQGTFAPFTEAELSLTDLALGGDTVLLGAISEGGGLIAPFSLTRQPPLNLLTDLEEDQCSAPTLHLEGGGVLEADDITFDLSVTVTVFTAIRS